MSQPLQSDVRNRLLQGLAPADYALLRPHLHRTNTQMRQTLIAANAPIRMMFFPESGFVSITTDHATKVEVGVIGREGLVGAAPVLLGGSRTPYEHFVQSPGDVLGIRTDDLLVAVGESPALRDRLLRFVQVLLVQTAQTAFVNATFDIEARLARWLLMCQDRLASDELLITHEFLAMMLGVQRTSVTLAIQTLEGTGMIRARRGRIELRDREQMVKAAGAGYGLPEAEYARLIEGAG